MKTLDAKLLLPTLLAGSMFAAVQVQAAPVMIDNFSIFQEVEDADPTDSDAAVGVIDEVAPAVILGGERDVRVLGAAAIAGDASSTSQSFTDPEGLLSANTDSSITGVVEIIWDGDDNDASTDDLLGLGGVDLIDSGNTSIVFSIYNQRMEDGLFSLTVYDMDGRNATVTKENDILAGPITDPISNGKVDMSYGFNEFFDSGLGEFVNFADIGMIKLEITGPADFDATIGPISAVPEPSAAALLALGVAGLALGRRRAARK